MRNRTTRRLTMLAIGLLFALLLSACGGAVPADVLAALPSNVEVSDSGSSVTFSGQIQAMGSDGWTVEGVSFTVNSTTQIKGDPALGDQVKVHLSPDLATGVLLATEIEPAEDQVEPSETSEPGDDLLTSTDEASSTPESDTTPETEATPGSEDYEFIGVVNVMGSGSWTINDKTVTITDQTEIKDAIIVGDTVKVEAQVQLDGTITAKEISLASSEDMKNSQDSEGGESEGIEVKISGVVQAYSDSSITVNGQTIAFLPSTEIEGVLAVGAAVEVEAYLTADGTLNAKSIEVKSDSAIETNSNTEDGYEMEDSSESESHHDGSSGDSESGSEDGSDGSGSHSDD